MNFYLPLMREVSCRFWLAAFFFLCLPAPTMAAQPKWITIQNENFRVYSTASERDTRDVLAQFERVRGFFAQFANSEAINAEPASVVIFGTEKEYRPFRLNEFAIAYYSSQSDRDYIVMGEVDEQSMQTAAHEFTHLVFKHAGYTLPPWLSEGLAELYSTLSPAGSETEFGDALEGRLYALNNEPWVPMQIILAADHSSPYYNETNQAGSLYDQSWALVHMLNTTERYRARFWSVVEAINRGVPSVDALENAYGMPFAKIENDLLGHIRGERFNKLRMKVKLNETRSLPSKPADAFEVREIHAELLMGLPGRQAEAKDRLNELTRESAGRADPWANLGYLAWREGKDREAVDLFAKAFELGSRSPRMMQDFGQLASQYRPEVAAPPLVALLELQPGNIDVRLALANLLINQERYTEAVATASSITQVRTAEQRDHLLYLRAFAATRLGYLADARALAEELRKVSTSPEMRFNAERILRYVTKQ